MLSPWLLGLSLVLAPHPELEEASIDTLAAKLARGETTSEALVTGYLARVAALDRAGPSLRAISDLNPDALADARALDAERKAGRTRGPLHGIPIVVKDNIDTGDAMSTTAGSRALEGSRVARDAPLVARLRAAGAIILGKTALSEWANIRSSRSTSGWSARAGLVKNPYALDRTACGSSSGTAAAVAASLAAAGVGTETDGSVLCPSSMTSLVGLKPTVGRVSRTGIIPISASQDTAGPMARTVADAARLLEAMIGPADPDDPATRGAPAYAAPDLAAATLAGRRLGVVRAPSFQLGPESAAPLEGALGALRAAGAVLVEVSAPSFDQLERCELDVLLYELKAGLDHYLSTRNPPAPVRSLAEVIAFDRAHADEELRWFGQDLFERAAALGPLTHPTYRAARDRCRRLARAEGIDRLLAAHRLDALVALTTGPAWVSDLVAGDHFTGASTSPAAVAGYPSLTVPAGWVHGLPVGLSFFGSAWSEPKLLTLGAAFERAAPVRRAPTYRARVSDE
jgi:amidase